MATTSTATATSLLALTTPFSQPNDCTDVFSTTDIVTSFWWGDYSETTLHVSVSGPAGSHFASCQPSGWADVVPERRFSFSPAVCPYGWTAYELGPITTLDPPITTAYCCARYGLCIRILSLYLSSLRLSLRLTRNSGYDLDRPAINLTTVGISSPACVSQIGVPPSAAATVTKRDASHSSPTFCPDGVQVHKAYHITWEASDRSTLSPIPPDLSCSTIVPKWVPGQSLAYSCPTYTNVPEHGSLPSAPVFFFLVVGLPLIAVTFFGACGGYCSYRIRKERRQRVVAGGGVEGK